MVDSSDFIACPCGDPECLYFEAGYIYIYCWFDGEHHRPPVAEGPEALCPIDRQAWNRGELCEV